MEISGVYDYAYLDSLRDMIAIELGSCSLDMRALGISRNAMCCFTTVLIQTAENQHRLQELCFSNLSFT